MGRRTPHWPIDRLTDWRTDRQPSPNQKPTKNPPTPAFQRTNTSLNQNPTDQRQQRSRRQHPITNRTPRSGSGCSTRTAKCPASARRRSGPCGCVRALASRGEGGSVCSASMCTHKQVFCFILRGEARGEERGNHHHHHHHHHHPPAPVPNHTTTKTPPAHPCLSPSNHHAPTTPHHTVDRLAGVLRGAPRGLRLRGGHLLLRVLLRHLLAQEARAHAGMCVVWFVLYCIVLYNVE